MADYTEQQLIGALRKADAAGDATAAKAIAQRLKAMRAPKADFSDVSTGSSTSQPQPSMLDRVGRELGLGGRAMLRGGADLVGVVADPFIQGANALGANQATMRQGADHLADRLGLPTPQTAAERVSSDVTGALTSGGGLIGLGRGLAGQVPGVAQRVGTMLAAQPGTQVASAAGASASGGYARESGAGMGGQVAASLLGGMAPAALKTAGSAGLRGLMRGGEEGRQQMAQSIHDFRTIGAAPSVGQATGNRRTQGLESLLAGAPASSGVMVRTAKKQADDIGQGLRQVADDFSPNASAERAGAAVKSGVENFSRDIAQKRSALYQRADSLIPPDKRLPLDRTRSAISELISPTPGAAETSRSFINPKFRSLAESIEQDFAQSRATTAGGVPTFRSGGLPYSTVKNIRTRIGQELSDYALSTDRPTAEYKKLYRALSEDMEAAAREQGPGAMQAVRRANNYFKASEKRLEDVQRVVDRNGGPEAIYTAVMSGTRDGGTTLRKVMQSLDRDGQRAVTAATIKRMGLATPGAQDAAGETFSAGTFLTNWNRVSPEAKRALFDRHGPKFADNMDRIARVAERIKEGSQVYANPSGTANRGLAYTYAGSLAASVLTGQAAAAGGLIGSGVLANGLARWMTNPRFVSWLARSTEVPYGAATQQVTALKSLAKLEKDEDMAALADALSQQAPNDQGQASKQRENKR